MQRKFVSSSRIRSVGWENNVMEVEFHDGAVYQYFNVTGTEYKKFLRSPSLGSALSRLDKVHKYICVCPSHSRSRLRRPFSRAGPASLPPPAVYCRCEEVNHVDTQKLREAVEYLRTSAMPFKVDYSAPCTVQDVRKVVDTLATVLMTFVEELEGQTE